MKSVLEELWYGNLCPQDEIAHNTRELKELRGLTKENLDKLCKSISCDKTELLLRYEESLSELNAACGRDLFIYAFGLGAKLMADALI